MKKKYRIKMRFEENYPVQSYVVQVLILFCIWVDVKVFYDPYEPSFAQLEAEELLEKLNE